MEFTEDNGTELQARWELMDERSANNSEDILQLSGPPSIATGEVLSLWRLHIRHVVNDEQPYRVALNPEQKYPGSGKYAILLEASEKEAKALFYSEEMFDRYPGGKPGRKKRIALYGLRGQGGPDRGQGRKSELIDPTVMSFKVSGELARRIRARAEAEGRSYADLLRKMADQQF